MRMHSVGIPRPVDATPTHLVSTLSNHTETMSSEALPPRINDESELEEALTWPSSELIDSIRALRSPLVILGAGGKMGPTLAVLARRAAQKAAHPLEIVAVSRFGNPQSREWFEQRGVETWSADLLDRKAVETLPDSENVIYLAGQKFGTQQNPAATWAANTLAPAHAAERYSGASIVALSTGNVYPFVSINSRGARENNDLTPIGEYANAAVARERIFEYFAAKQGTPMALLRLSYAIDLRYGVLHDIARMVWDSVPVNVGSGCFNCIWQGDANEMILRSFAVADIPPATLNLTASGVCSVRDVATRFSELLDRSVQFVGTESDTALLSDTEHLSKKLGHPQTTLDSMIAWTAHWVRNGGSSLNKPTHFDVRDGKY